MRQTILKAIRLLHLIDKKTYNEQRQIEAVRTSKLFDKKYYLNQNPDIRTKHITAHKHFAKYGWKEGRNPSKHFNTNEYLSLYPELREKNICPLFHKEKIAKSYKTHLKTFPKSATPQTYTSTLPVNNQHKRIAVFASYSANGQIPDYVVYYLKELKKITDAIIFIADNPINKEEITKIAPYITYASFKRHEEYDFGSYKRGYDYALTQNLIQNTDELILCNDSCYGPVIPFQQIFKKMSQTPCDFWGMLSNTDIRYHLQSYFIVFKKNILKTPALKNFLNTVKKENSFMDVVYNYEFKLTENLIKLGFTSASYTPEITPKTTLKTLQNGNNNRTLFPLTLMKHHHFPLIKLKFFTNDFAPFYTDSKKETLNYLKKANPKLYKHIIKDLKEKNLLENTKEPSYKSLISKASLISFDIFDTLLIRPTVTPTDLFKLIEIEQKAQGFALARIDAETRARLINSSKEDITLDDIYQQILPKFTHLKKEELNQEEKLLFAHPKNKKLYLEAIKQKKPVIITSDMYLPTSFLKKVLEKNGFTNIKKIYVSGDYNKTKGSANLFKQIIKDFNPIPPQKILHIGDNQQADINVPKSLGLITYHTPKYIDDFLKKQGNLKYKEAYTKAPTLETSLITALSAYHQLKTKNTTYWQEIGYNYAGPLALGYTQMIDKEARLNKIDTLLFVSRDGYMLRLAYNTLIKKPLKNHYIYAPRLLNLKCFGNYCDNPGYLKKYLNLLNREIPEIAPVANYEENKMLLKKHQQKIKNYHQTNLKTYLNYLKKENITGKRIASIDMTTSAFSSEKFLKEIFKNRYILGFFSATFQKNNLLKYIPYKKELINPKTEEAILMLTELLITAPELPLKDFKNEKPIFKELNPNEKERLNAVKEIEKGLKIFLKDFKQRLKTNAINLTMEQNMIRLENYITHLNAIDNAALKTITHTPDIANENAISLLEALTKKSA